MLPTNDLEDIRYKRRKSTKKKKEGTSSRTQSFKNCTRCGNSKHSRDRCPAQDVACFKCGHNSSMCMSKRAADTEVSAISEATFTQLQNVKN